MPKVHFKSPLDDVTVEVTTGTTLLDAAEKAAPRWATPAAASARAPPATSGCCKGAASRCPSRTDPEMDRLDMGFDVRPYSRLACQAVVGREDLQVEITEESLTAYMDENPALRRALEADGEMAAEEVPLSAVSQLDGGGGGSCYTPPAAQRAAVATCPGGGIGRHTRFRV